MCCIIVYYMILYYIILYHIIQPWPERFRPSPPPPGPSLPRPPGALRPISLLRSSLLKFVDSRYSGKSHMDLGIPPFKIKIMLESNPLKSRILVRKLAVQQRCVYFPCLRVHPYACKYALVRDAWWAFARALCIKNGSTNILICMYDSMA